MRWLTYLLCLCCVGIGFFAALTTDRIFEANEQVPAIPHGEPGEQFEQYWYERLTAGADESYEEFKKAYAGASPTDQHLAAHLFGGLLYTQYGLDALDVCDTAYSYGCFHELIGRAIQEQGIVVLETIDEFCKQSFDCQHGIGHGIVAFYGYEPEHLLASLALCTQLGSVDPHDGCYGGIFMEYNTRTMLYADGVPPRQWSSGTPADDVCAIVPVEAHAACYFWIPQWIMALFAHGDLRTMAENAARACREIEDRTDRTTCVKGMGYELVVYSQNPEELRQFCASAGAADETLVAQCLGAAAAALFTTDNARDRAPLLCDGLDDAAYTYCDRHASFSDGRRIPNVVHGG